MAPTLRELKARRRRAGPEPIHHRSSFIEWNPNAELFAFAKRLNEDFNRESLQQAFTDRSFIVQEELKQREVGIEEPVLNIKDNAELVKHGDELISNYVRAFIGFSFPRLPADGATAVHKWLVSEETLARISSHIGTKDLILSSEIEPSAKLLAQTFKALVSSLQRSAGDDRAFAFVRDFVLTQLNQKDLHEIWIIERPFERLREICRQEKFGEPEPRDLGKAGEDTVLAVFRAGIYCDKKLISQGCGEDWQMAIDVASLHAINKFYDTEEWRTPLKFTATLQEVVGAATQSKEKATRV